MKTEEKKKQKQKQTELKIRLNSDDPLHSSTSQMNSAPQASLLPQHLEKVTAFVYYLEAHTSFGGGKNQPGHLNTVHPKGIKNSVCIYYKARLLV